MLPLDFNICLGYDSEAEAETALTSMATEGKKKIEISRGMHQEPCNLKSELYAGATLFTQVY